MVAAAVAVVVVAAVDTETVAVSLHSFDCMSYASNHHSYGTGCLEDVAAAAAAVVVVVVVAVAAAAAAVVSVVAADDMTVCNHHDDCDAASDDVVNACFVGYADDLNIDGVVDDIAVVVVESLSLQTQFHDR